MGFEPTVAFTTPLFESGTFNHSDTSPAVEYMHRDRALPMAWSHVTGRPYNRRGAIA